MSWEISYLHGIHVWFRSWLKLRKYLVKVHEIPTDVVGDLKTQLLRMLVDLRGWNPYDGLSVKLFDEKMSVINELLKSRYEMWDPRAEPVLGRLLGTMERITTFGVGGAWNDRYTSICRECSEMSRSTFVWTCDLADKISDRLERNNDLEPGFEDQGRLMEDMTYVTSYDEQVRHLTEPS